MARDGKTVLYDGRTGEPFDNRIYFCWSNVYA